MSKLGCLVAFEGNLSLQKCPDTDEQDLESAMLFCFRTHLSYDKLYQISNSHKHTTHIVVLGQNILQLR